MRLPEGEPEAGGWHAVRLDDLAARLLRAAGSPSGRPAVMAIDGRSSSSGKTTLAARLSEIFERVGAGHVATGPTDDVAWRHAAFDWVDLLVTGILAPLRDGRPVSFRPPAWVAHERVGAIDIADDARLVLLEGVGSSRRSLLPWLDTAVYVQSDLDVIDRRNAERVAAWETTPADFHSWLTEEVAFVLADRPWERADLVACDTLEVPHDPVREVVVSRRSRVRERS